MAERLNTQDPITLIWLKQQFDKLHKEHVVIIDKLNELEKLSDNVNAELDLAWRQLKRELRQVDRKVPDKQPNKKEQ